ncbi:hypothetical protein [Enterococcus faecium]|uniref:hypothetical protein n=1 Tax=Enterococcus faecium TaxID=1352 RepID=UPI001E51B35B|nr:hypothetical protein [Enterococcus faecium]MCE3183350.1 hypothetical protein [Enterococcus faecium]MCW8791904.1 hypothetical protein [Enterococcus faecium]MCW8794502.1 hypothetical protein [Enterococcus faecium]
MGLLKLISNRISTEWKEKFNKNIDYLNDLEKKLSDQDKSTNSRIDNLVLHSGGESPNEVVDARVNNKGETFPTLHGRLVEHETLTDEQISELITNSASQKAQVEQLNKAVQQIIGGYNEPINIYVSKDGSDILGDGSEEKPFLTIQTAVNNVPLITTSQITIWVGSGAYLEDIMIRNLNFTSFLIRPLDNFDAIDPSTSDLPVKIRSICFTACKGYCQVAGMQIVDTANGADYGIRNEQSGYMAINRCKFAENTKTLARYNAIYVGGTSKINMYGDTTLINQKVAIYAVLMGEIIVSAFGSGNDIGILCENGTARGTVSPSFATTPTKTIGYGLIITKGTVL